MSRRKQRPAAEPIEPKPTRCLAVHLPLRPCPAPRSTRASWWRKAREANTPVGRYAAWRDHVLALLHGAPVLLPLRPPVQVVMALHQWVGQADLDNYQKALLDALTRAGWLLQDNCKHVIDVRAYLVESDLEGVTVLLYERERLPRWRPENFGLSPTFGGRLGGSCDVAAISTLALED